MARFTRGFDQPTLPDAPQAPAREQVRKNKFGAKCVNCGVFVPENTGRLEKNDRSGKWEVSHIPPCPTASEAQDTPAEPERTERNFSVPDGRYTVVWADHHKTIRVRTQDAFDDFMPGRPILEFLSGANNDRDYTRFGHVAADGTVRIWKKHQANETLREAVKVLLGDPKAASQAYAEESNQCSRCGRTLTVPASIHAGLGPECAKKVEW